ncbi:hypothetical protein JW962_01485 [Candidatus Dojkabacteria bacterium]|nr:hypothetical protein [Candidatus Dojkabacteria bacterium]
MGRGFPVFASGTPVNEQGIVASPTHILEDLSPGQTKVQEFKITNHLSYPQSFRMESRQISIDTNGNPYVPEGTEVTPAKLESDGYIAISPKEFYLEIGESVLVTVQITLPIDSNPTGYYLELAVTPSSPQLSDDTMLGGYEEIAIPIALNYTGESEEIFRNILINSFRVENPNHNFYTRLMKSFFKDNSQIEVFEYLPANFITHLVNDGNQHVVVTGQIFISKDPDFKNPITLDLNPGNKVVFMSGGRYFTNTWDDSFIVIDDSGNTQLDWSKFKDFRFGKYYAQLNVIWDKGITDEIKSFTTSTITFYVIPIRLILMIIGIILLIGLILFGLFKLGRISAKSSKDKKPTTNDNNAKRT